MNFKHISVSRYRASLSLAEKQALLSAVENLRGSNERGILPEEITNHVTTSRKNIYKTVEKVLDDQPIGLNQKEILVATLHYGKTLVE